MITTKYTGYRDSFTAILNEALSRLRGLADEGEPNPFPTTEKALQYSEYSGMPFFRVTGPDKVLTAIATGIYYDDSSKDTTVTGVTTEGKPLAVNISLSELNTADLLGLADYMLTVRKFETVLSTRIHYTPEVVAGTPRLQWLLQEMEDNQTLLNIWEYKGAYYVGEVTTKEQKGIRKEYKVFNEWEHRYTDSIDSAEEELYDLYYEELTANDVQEDALAELESDDAFTLMESLVIKHSKEYRKEK